MKTLAVRQAEAVIRGVRRLMFLLHPFKDGGGVLFRCDAKLSEKVGNVADAEVQYHGRLVKCSMTGACIGVLVQIPLGEV
jgi:hypothetical protein